MRIKRLKRITLDVEPRDHQRLKIDAARSGVSIRKMILIRLGIVKPT